MATGLLKAAEHAERELERRAKRGSLREKRKASATFVPATYGKQTRRSQGIAVATPIGRVAATLPTGVQVITR